MMARFAGIILAGRSLMCGFGFVSMLVCRFDAVLHAGDKVFVLAPSLPRIEEVHAVLLSHQREK